MALITCPDCGGKVSEHASACPHCGCLVSYITDSENNAAISVGPESKDFQIEDGILIKYTGKGGDVVVPTGVKKIGKNAFFYCSSLTSVTIPDSMTEIGWWAFSDCSSLTNVTIPDSVKIMACAFEGTPVEGELGVSEDFMDIFADDD